MISRLHIRNYALIEELDLRFSNQLTIVTGETGAGKSIMLGALGLVMGNRADTRVLFNDQEKCVVEAYFSIKDYDLKEFFEENDLDYEDEITIRREISPAGKSRAFISDTPATLDVVEGLTARLLDLHQQFDTLDIARPDFQLQVIDALSENKILLKEYRSAFREYKSQLSKLQKLRDENARSIQESDFLSYQLEEFNKAELLPDELPKLEKELEKLTNAEDIKRVTAGAFRALTDDEQSIAGMLESVAQALRPVAKFHAELPKIQDRLLATIEEIKDLGSEFESIAEDTEYDGARITEVQGRLNMIYKLLKKHLVATVPELIAIQDGIAEKLKGFSDLSSQIEALEMSTAAQELELKKKALVLRERRTAAIPLFEQKLHHLLGQVAMEFAKLEVSMTPSEELLPSGQDKLRFLWAANRGSRLEEIKGTASGGELSRLAFVIKSLVANAIPLPTMIFDEIDSGVSGDVSQKMGGILRNLSRERQVISITHSPQIAAKADTHFFVYKNVQPHRTISAVRTLNPEERIWEIAKMLSGDPPSEAAKENARSLLGV